MIHTDQPPQSARPFARTTSRRRLLVGLAGGGALLLLNSPAIYVTVKNIQRLFTTRRLDLSDVSSSAVWSDNLEYLAAPRSESLDIWDYEQERIIRTFRLDQTDDTIFTWFPDNRRLLSISGQNDEDALLICRDVQAQQQLYSARGDFYLPLGEISWSPDGKKLVSFYSGKLFVLDASNGQTLYTQDFSTPKSDQRRAIKAACWSPDGNKVALLTRQTETNEYAVVIWDIVNRQQTAQLGKQVQDGDNFQDTPLSWSPSSDYLATILNKKLQLLHVRDSNQNVVFTDTFQEDDHLLAWSPDGRYLAATDSGKIGIWDSSQKELARMLYRGQFASRIVKLAWPGAGQEVDLINSSYDLVHFTW